LQNFCKEGSLPTFAAFAHRKNWVAAPSVRFLQVAQFSFRVQRTSAIRGGLNWSTQHTLRTFLLASDIARSCEAVR
jgi:hypothetical protein